MRVGGLKEDEEAAADTENQSPLEANSFHVSAQVFCGFITPTLRNLHINKFRCPAPLPIQFIARGGSLSVCVFVCLPPWEFAQVVYCCCNSRRRLSRRLCTIKAASLFLRDVSLHTNSGREALPSPLHSHHAAKRSGNYISRVGRADG